MLDLSEPHHDMLWKALKQGDKTAFGQIYELHYRSLYGYGYKLLPDAACVEDAIQDLFVQLWRSRETLSEVREVKFYLFRALRREIARLLEKSRRFEHIDDERNACAEPDEYFFVQDEQEKLLTKKLMRMLSQLPERQMEVVTLRFFENFKTEEIAAIMGISEKSVRNTLYKALGQLRESTHDLVPFMELLFLLTTIGKLV